MPNSTFSVLCGLRGGRCLATATFALLTIGCFDPELEPEDDGGEATTASGTAGEESAEGAVPPDDGPSADSSGDPPPPVTSGDSSDSTTGVDTCGPDECPSCGNGVTDGQEECDGEDLAGATCESLGYDGGPLTCVAATCAYDTSQCVICDECGTCDTDQSNDCVMDCSGAWGGGATFDACGTCDEDPTNDCFDGMSAVLSVADSDTFDIGSGTLFWSVSGGNEGFFYAGEFTTPEVQVANVTPTSECSVSESGYAGLTSLSELTDASTLDYSVPNPTIRFGTLRSDCNMGLLVFRQGEQYGVIEFQSIGPSPDSALTLRYWIGSPGVTNFSNAD